MGRQPGLLVLLTLSHPRGFWDGKQSEMVGWLSPAGLVIIQSHVSHSAPGVLQISSEQQQQQQQQRETERGVGEEKLLFVMYLYGIQCEQMQLVVMKHGHKYAC